MKRFFLRVLRFFWWWRFLKFLFFSAALVVLLYVEEDLRGARMLADAQARWKAAGFSLDPASYIPPPVPDDQNLAALPEFQYEPDPKNPGWVIPARLRDAIDAVNHGGTLQTYQLHEDFAADVQAAYARKFPGITPPQSAVEQLEQLYPFIVKLRSAAATRPLFRLNEDFTTHPIWARPISLTVRQLGLAKLLWFHSRLALRENKSAVAARDVGIGLQIARGLGPQPTLVSALISIGIVGIERGILYEGLGQHAWSDAQLTVFEKEFGSLDEITMGKQSLAGEEVAFGQVMLRELRGFAVTSGGLIKGIDDDPPNLTFEDTLFFDCWPRGWQDSNAALSLELVRRAAAVLELKSREVDVKSFEQLRGEFESRGMVASMAPWNILALVSTSMMINVDKQIARAQVADDEACIACALERYRLAHGAYPAALDALVPAYIDALPHDVMNGEPFHYRVNGDGTFLLYSVGWDQKDDGGTIAYRDPSSASIDFDHADWVWPMMVTGKR
jgi:hypothetical protein